MASETLWLNRLAHQQRLITQYRDSSGFIRQARPEHIVTMLQTLGVPIAAVGEARAIVHETRQAQWQQGPPPVAVANSQGYARLVWALPWRCQRVDYVIQDETGASVHGSFVPPVLATVASAYGQDVACRKLVWQSPALTMGYHTVHWDFLGRTAQTLIIAPPPGAPQPDHPQWGLFMPLYGLMARNHWRGAGDFATWQRLAIWTRQAGGDFVGTLPLLPTFMQDPYDPSPYRPVSQLFWNEFYLDVPGLLAETGMAPAQGLTHHCQDSRVHYRQEMALKRKLLERLMAHADTSAFQAWISAHPEVQPYAQFRATVEKLPGDWTQWPNYALAPDIDNTAVRYHEFVQWQADRALQSLASQERAGGGGLYLDLPIGVHPDGYDAWRYRDLFVRSATVGAPPDAFFSGGQNWGMPPLHPERLRSQGYAYFIQTLRHHLQFAKVLRIDHVMGFYRRFWIPQSAGVEAGLYVRYPAEEFYAIIDLEARRSGTVIVGENLGLVPRAVNTAIRRHHYLGTWIWPTESAPPPVETLAVIGTHDMPPWSSFWKSRTPAQKRVLQERLGLHQQHATAAAMLTRVLDALAQSPSRLILINLEDLYGETQPVNVPGTGSAETNWTRKARFAWESLEADPIIRGLLKNITCQRRHVDIGTQEEV